MELLNEIQNGLRDLINSQGPNGLAINCLLPAGIAYTSANFGSDRLKILEPHNVVGLGMIAIILAGLSSYLLPHFGLHISPIITNLAIESGIRMVVGGAAAWPIKYYVTQK